MKFPLVLCIAAISCLGIQAWELAHITYPTEGRASMETSYIGKLISNENGVETCVGTFSGSNVFHNQHPEGSWDAFSQRCRDLVGGLVLMMSNTASSSGCCGAPTSVDLTMKTRINNVGKSECEQVVQIQPVATYSSDECTETPVTHIHAHSPHFHIRPKPRPVTPIVVEQEPVPVIVQPVIPVTPQPTREIVEIIKEKPEDDCIEEKHEHHHKHHHKEHHKHHHHKHHEHPIEYIREIREPRPRTYIARTE